MTSSIFRPRRSRACPEPRTHLTESTILVLPEPFGPTIAVTPPSKRISVWRANVLKPERVMARRCTGGAGYQKEEGEAQAAARYAPALGLRSPPPRAAVLAGGPPRAAGAGRGPP